MSQESKISPGEWGIPTDAPISAKVHPLSRIRYQLVFGLLTVVVVPGTLYHISQLSLLIDQPSSLNSMIGAAIAFIFALILYRRVATFPGVGIVSYVMPAVAVGYGVVLALFFGLRLDYSRFYFAISFVASVVFFFYVSVQLYLRTQRRFYVIPSEHASNLTKLPGASWIFLTEPSLPSDPRAVLIADLRAEMDDSWERLIAEASLHGFPVYHFKQVQESLTGKVDIEHLSENSFGSLIPNHGYHKFKRLLDLTLSLAVLPILVPPALIVAVIIKAQSPGPVFFRQVRRGYRGKVFQVLKFRTMEHRTQEDPQDLRESAITQNDDPRITRIGHFLRRTRIDELPQIWNVIRGEMSWIGPRPEAITLSKWYMEELPFYVYRHIVRPGITGWAQVNQGHVADLDGVLEKLHYDFFYIKYFSGWLDLLIVWRTFGVIFSGHGAK